MLDRAKQTWYRLGPEDRLAAVAAIALLFTMFLPWYEKNVFVTSQRRFVTDSISAFGDLSFIEAAVFLVSAGVLALLYARATGARFHLPGGDGTVILAAGGWAAVLLLWRVFDRPDVTGVGATVGIQWGLFFAFLAAAGLAVAGLRMRQAHVPEPHNPMADDPRTPADESASEQLTLLAEDPPARSARRPPREPPARRRDPH
jgi:hypothetical protein